MKKSTYKIGDKVIFINKHNNEDEVNGTVITILKLGAGKSSSYAYEGVSSEGLRFLAYEGEVHPLTKLHKALL